MLTITFCKGIPGSGKSHWAAEEVLRSNGSTVRVNKDSLRTMLHSGEHSKGREEFILEVRNKIIEAALIQGKHVIVDDTNFEPKHREAMDVIVENMKRFDIQVRVVEKFFDTPIEECIARDIKRANGVGEKVIRGMYNKYLAPPPPELKKQDESLPPCIIVDIDGTLAKMKDRGPFEWDKVGQDEPHQDIINLAHHLSDPFVCSGYINIIIVSGRDGSCRVETEDWLIRNRVMFGSLYMRPEGNNEKDTIIKERIYREHIEGKYNVKYVLDDRNSVVQMWRQLGLRCLQVADGNF